MLFEIFTRWSRGLGDNFDSLCRLLVLMSLLLEVVAAVLLLLVLLFVAFMEWSLA